MTEKLRVAVTGVGRMGPIHALHVHELAQEKGDCVLSALVDMNVERARTIAADIGWDAQVFASVEALLKAGASDATVIVTPTGSHGEHAATLAGAGQRVLMEKPLTGTLEGDREFAAQLDRDHPESLMLAFQRRFDGPLEYAKQLMKSGVVGRVFKIYSSLEDSNPAPNGYQSGGILPDMSVRNVDEILWLAAPMPTSALVSGSRIYSYKLAPRQEDLDHAVLYLSYCGDIKSPTLSMRHHGSR